MATRLATRLNPSGYYPSPRHPVETRSRGLHSKTLLAGVVLAVTVVAAGGPLTYSMTHRPPELDAALCNPNLAPQTHVAFLIDLTDRLSLIQATEVTDTVRAWQERLNEGDRLSIFALNPKPSDADSRVPSDTVPQPKVLFSMCKPADGRAVNEITGNRRLVENRYRIQFEAPLSTALDDLGKERAPADSSPILQAIYWVGQHAPAFGAKQPNQATNRVLVVVSDLLEHSEIASFFRTGYSFKRLAASGRIYLDRDVLSGIRVSVYQLINRHQGRQTEELRAFWEQYFRNAGSDLDGIKHL